MPKTDITIDMSEFMEFVDSLNDDMVLVAIGEAKKLMQESLYYLEGQIAGRTPVNLGSLRASISHDIEIKSTGLLGMVTTPLPYAMPVEKGRKAGKWPPRAAIRAWVVQKGIATGKNADSAAFLIARAIGQGRSSGIMRPGGGAKMFEEGFNAAEPQIRRKWDALPERVLKRLGR